MLSENDFPTVQEIAEALAHVPACVEPEMIEQGENVASIDVRLQVLGDGTWSVHTGDASYDQDHRGYWSCGCVVAEDTPEDLMALAKDLREQALESCYECGDLEESSDEVTP